MRVKHYNVPDQTDFSADGSGPYNSWLNVRLVST